MAVKVSNAKAGLKVEFDHADAKDEYKTVDRGAEFGVFTANGKPNAAMKELTAEPSYEDLHSSR